MVINFKIRTRFMLMRNVWNFVKMLMLLAIGGQALPMELNPSELSPPSSDTSSTISPPDSNAILEFAPIDTSILLPGSQLPAFALKTPRPTEVLRFQTKWRKALMVFRASHYLEAAKLFQELDPSEKLAEIYRTSYFAQSCLLAGKNEVADSALEVTLGWVSGLGWQRHLFEMRLSTFDYANAKPEKLKIFSAQIMKSPLDIKIKTEVLFRVLDLDSLSLSIQERYETVRELVRIAPKDERLEALYNSWYKINAPGTGSWVDQKIMLVWEEKLGLVKQVLKRIATMISMAPNKKEMQNLEWRRALLIVNTGTPKEAIPVLIQYQERYGDSPELLMQLARMYKKQDLPDQSRYWYSQLAEEFPKHAKASEIYWMWAFDFEMERQTAAIDLYAQIANQYAGTKRGEWALFRPGLIYFKQGQYKAALEHFRATSQLRPSSAASQAGRFWEAKTLEILGDSTKAQPIYLDLVTHYPFGFYGHIARIILEARGRLPENLLSQHRFTPSNPESIKTWFKKVSPDFSESLVLNGESVYLPLTFLLEWRMESVAIQTIRNLSGADLKNPWAVYIYAGQCQNAGMWRESYLLGTKLADILPLESWGEAPLPVLKKMYPRAYAEVVIPNSMRNNLPSSLVFALMKQESGFDTKIASKAGARGLMQMIPKTAFLQGKREGLENFNADQLYDPKIGIQLGCAFLGDVVRRYQGNLYFALAHYNAGPTALNQWMPRLEKRLPEEAAEDIDFTETRDYVKRVLANYWTYQILYE